MDAEEARRKLEEKQERDMRERRQREARELERVKREEYTRMTKNRILGQLEAKIDASKKALVRKRFIGALKSFHLCAPNKISIVMCDAGNPRKGCHRPFK
jgi:hypothetical protein